MKRSFTLGALFVILGLSFSLQAHAEELRCYAGIQPDKQKNEYVSERKSADFTTSEVTINRRGKSYLARKYRVEIENFLVEGTLYLDSGAPAQLSITDQTIGAIAEVEEHRLVRLSMSSPRTVGLVQIFAGCEHW